jgi:hypothetical protein
MALSYDWGNTEAWKNPITITDDHPLYQEVVDHLESSDNWYRNEDTGEIQCVQPFLEAMTWWSMSLDLCGVTEKNIDEWLFRIKYARKVGWFNRDQGKFPYLTEDGWTTRPITRKDMESVVGLKCNVATTSRSKWLRRVQQQIAAQVDEEVREM